MNLSKPRVVLTALVVSESAWVYAAASVVGVAMGRDGSPLGWPAILMVLGASVVVARLSPKDVEAVEFVHLMRLLIGAALVYAAVAVQAVPGVDLGWIAKIGSDAAPDGLAFKGVIGSMIGVGLWVRGFRAAVAEDPLDSLTFSMRLGVVALGVGMVLDVASPVALGIFPMVFVFFAAALSGLATGNLMGETRPVAAGRIWPKVIAATIAGVLVTGLAFSLVRGSLLSFVSEPAGWVLSMMAKGVFFLVVFPLSTMFNFVVDFFLAISEGTFGFEAPAPEQPADAAQAAMDAAELERLEEDAENLDFVLQMIQIALLVLVTIVLLFVLFKLLQRVFGGQSALSSGARDSVGDTANALSDFRRLLNRLLPDFLKRRPGSSRTLPDGPYGVVEVFRIYYRLLAVAERRGIKRGPDKTTLEFQAALEGQFPKDLVLSATGAFNRACYGHHPASEEQIARMWTALRSLSSVPGAG